ncbi:hypothetical protein [Sinorhizobium sojae]|nr:hypothetical protein [Sinorhizobium sojae]
MEMLLAVGQAVLAERERAWNAGYLSGFMASGEGWNGEYPFEFRGSPEDDETWIERREEIRRGAK